MSLLHPIATSLSNNVDGLQFWNCSLNTGLSLVYLTALWLRISLDDCHKQQVWSHVGFVRPWFASTSRIVVIFDVYTTQLPCKRKRLKALGLNMPLHIHASNRNKTMLLLLPDKNMFGLFLDVSDSFRVRPAGPPLAFTTNPTMLAVCRQIVTNSLLRFQSLAVQVQV